MRAAHAIAHNKVMIIGNAENLLVIRSKELASTYIENWERHKEHSESYSGR